MTAEPITDSLVKVARDLREILALHADLRDQAVNKSTDRELPGGNAMVMLGNVANLEAWRNQADTAERLWWEADGSAEDRPQVDADEDDDWQPPLQTLLFWSEAWRIERDAVSDLRPTIASEVKFLSDSLEWAWQREAHFNDFERDVRLARLRIENELKAGERAERTRVTCIDTDCEKQPRLIRVYGETVTADHYKCPACKRRYNRDEFIRAKHQMLASEGADQFVKKQDVIADLDRSKHTIAKWLKTCEAIAYCDVVTRQVWVWWPSVREMDINTPRRNRKVA